MVFYKPAKEWEQSLRTTTSEEFVDKVKEEIVWENQFFRGARTDTPYFDTNYADVRVDEGMRTVYLFILNYREESFFMQFDFEEPIDSVYVNHKGETVYYIHRIICIKSFLNAVKESAEYDLMDIDRCLKNILPRHLLDLEGGLAVVGSGSIIRGRALYNDEFPLSFKLCTQYVANEEYKDLLLSIISDISGKRNPVDIDRMEGHEFELFCADLLRNNGFSNVEVTRGSGDQGIDVLATRDFVKYGFQCKCYSSDIGNKAVQEAHAGKTYYGCHVAVVLTNRYFTPAAEKLAEQVGVVLWDRDQLLDLAANMDHV